MNRFALRATTMAVILAVALLVMTPPLAAQEKPGGKALEARAAANQKAGTAADAAPEIYFPEAVHDFGTIARGSRVSHNFIVKNTGSAPLRLIKAKAT